MKTDTLNKKKKRQHKAHVADSLPDPLLVNVKPVISSQYFVYLLCLYKSHKMGVIKIPGENTVSMKPFAALAGHLDGHKLVTAPL